MMDGSALARDMERATVALLISAAILAGSVGALAGYVFRGCNYTIKIEKVEAEHGDD